MQLGMIGLGRMGGNMAKRLLQAGHQCVVYDRSAEHRESLKSLGATAANHLRELKEALQPPRAIWLMLPAGDPTDSTIQKLMSDVLSPGDIVIDGGNSHYKDDVRRAAQLDSIGVRYLDVGTSGGIWGLERGYCLMIGGDESAARHLDPIFASLAPGPKLVPSSSNRRTLSTADQGYIYCGKHGSGHFVKMIHNGIEYGMMQAFAEGFQLLRCADSDGVDRDFRYPLELSEIAEVWRRGSVVSSWLLDLIALALNRDEDLTDFEGIVQDSGEGRWTVQAAIELGVPANVITQSLFVRFRSQESSSYAEHLLSAMRAGFGGHQEPRRKVS